MTRRLSLYLAIVVLLEVVFFCPGARFVFAAKNIRIGLASAGAPGTTTELACNRFKEIVEKRTNGAIEIDRYPAGVLYKDKAACSAISRGSIEMAMLSAPVMGMRSRVLEFICSSGAWGLWKSVEHYRRFLDNPEVRKIALAECETKYHSRLLAYIPYGPSVVGSKRPIHTLSDYSNLKLRTIGSASAAVYRAFGAVPTELSSAEIYMGLQRGLINGAATGPARFLKSKLYEVTPYFTQDFTLPELPFVLLMNIDDWKALLPEYQKICEDAASEITKWSRRYVVIETTQAYKSLEEKKEVKEVFFLPMSERKKLAEIAEPAIKQYVHKQVGGNMGKKLLRLLGSCK